MDRELELRKIHEPFALADKKLANEIAARKAWAESLPVCKFCGDVASEAGNLFCQDCFNEMKGRSNGAKQLYGKGHAGVRVLDENRSDGLPGRMGWNGPSWDLIVRAYEEDR